MKNLKFDNRMPQHLHVAVCNGLMTQMDSPADCDHSHARTKRLLESNGVAESAPALEWLREHGGHCDCEVILNTAPIDDEPMH